MKILVINGPNLDMLGIREKGIYGAKSLTDLENDLRDEAKIHDISIEFFQSNHEGYIIEKIHDAREGYDGIIINPGAFGHYSYAILDAIKSIETPTVEVHISNVHKREEFRKNTVLTPGCVGVVCGLGLYSYKAALLYFIEQR